MRSATVYRSLLRLYPKDFRTEFDDDLVQHFAELVADRGARAAWARTTTDLMVTVPRYRMESLMNDKASSAPLYLAIGLLALGGFASIVGDIRFPGVVLLFAAIVLAVAQRSALARSIRTPDSNRRRRRLIIGGVLSLIFVLSIMSYMRDIYDENISGLSLILHNAIGVPAMVGAAGFLLAGLLTPNPPKPTSTAQPIAKS